MTTLTDAQIQELLAEIPALRKEVALLKGLLQELIEEALDPDEGLVLKPEFEEKLRRSLQQPHDTDLTSEEVLRRFGGGKAT